MYIFNKSAQDLYEENNKKYSDKKIKDLKNGEIFMIMDKKTQYC